MNATAQKGESNSSGKAEPPLDSLFKELSSSPEGLTGTGAKERLEKYGPITPLQPYPA